MTNDERRAWLTAQAEQLGMQEHEMPPLDRVLALLDYVQPDGDPTPEQAQRALEQVAEVEDHGQELIDPTAVTDDPLAWARSRGIDEATAARIDELIGDMYDLPSATWLYAHGADGLAAAQRAVEAEAEHGIGSPATDEAVQALDQIDQHTTIRQDQPKTPVDKPDPLERANQWAREWAKKYEGPRDLADRHDLAAGGPEHAEGGEKPATPLFDAELAKAIEQARGAIDRIQLRREDGRQADRERRESARVMDERQAERGSDLSL